MDIRARAAAVLDRAKVFEAVLWVRRRIPPLGRFPILCYHHIHELGPDYAFDDGVVDASPAEFDAQMEFVSRWFTPVGIEDIRASLHGTPLPENAIAITFDDGYRSNLETVVPILKRHGVRAIFFFATSYITERKLFWWDRIAYLVKKSKRETVSLAYPIELTLDLRSSDARARAINTLHRIVKDIKRLDLDRFLDALSIAVDVPYSRELDKKLAEEVVLTWDQVRAIRAAGMGVQSHTKYHRVLATISREEATRELGESRVELERELGEQVYAVSYPVGADIDGNQELIDAVRSAGYEVGFASKGGTNVVRPGADRALHFARMVLDYGTPMSQFRGTLALPRLVVPRHR